MSIAQHEPDLSPEVRGWLSNQLFDHVPSNILVVDRSFRVVLANHQFTEVFGDPVGKRCYQVYKRRESICSNCLAARTFADGEVHVNDEEGIDRKGESAHYVVYTAPIYDSSGEITHVIEMSHDVTETKTLQRSYNLLFDRAPCYISVINRDLRVVRANEQLRQKFGERIGEHCYEVYKQRSDQCPDCPALKTFADGRCYQSTQVGMDKDGSATHYAVSTSPLARSTSDFNHVIELSTDITAVRQLTSELERESSFQRILIESTLDALVAMDATGRVTIFNSAAEDLFQRSAAEVLGQPSIERFMPRRFVHAIERGEQSLSLPETTVVDAQGVEIPVRFSGSVLRDGNHIIGSAAFFQDLREFKRLQKENVDNERLAAVGQTVAQLAHGIKNILNGLQGGMYIIKSGKRSSSQQRIDRGWSMLERNVERITVLVKGFLNFAKGHRPQVLPTDPNTIAQAIYDLYQETAANNGITLRWTPGREIEPAPMDYEEMYSCLANLVSNAIDACQTSDNKRCTITIQVVERDQTIIFSVQDSGCGMDYEIKSKVFTTFFTTKGTEGTGLGLLTTRKIVQEHGGYIEVESTPGAGSTFLMRFPRGRLPSVTGENTAKQVRASGGSNGETRG